MSHEIISDRTFYQNNRLSISLNRRTQTIVSNQTLNKSPILARTWYNLSGQMGCKSPPDL